jgi:transcriptional regulator with XRE-family HTH domain
VSQLLRRSFASLCRDTRVGLDITQQQLADAAGVTRGYIAMVEGGRANPSLALVERIGGALGLELRLVGQAPVIMGRERRAISCMPVVPVTLSVDCGRRHLR